MTTENKGTIVWEVDNPWYRRGPIQIIGKYLVWVAGKQRAGRWSYVTCCQPLPVAPARPPEALIGLCRALAPEGSTEGQVAELACFLWERPAQ